MSPLTPELALRYWLPRNTRGVVVEEVDPDGRAAVAGILARDAIEEVDRQPVQNVDELRAVVRKVGERPLLVFVTVRPNNS